MQMGKVALIGIATLLRPFFLFSFLSVWSTRLIAQTLLSKRAHTSHHHQTYFDVADLQRLVWPGNLPDLGPEQKLRQAWEELEQWRVQALIERILRHSFIYLFIRHDGMQPKSYGPLEKQIKCLERERTNNPKVMPSSLMNKCKMQK
jgi:hypothetical protein